MAGFSDIDRQFQRKSPATIKLECLNCGGTSDTVSVRRPKWYNGFKDIALCDTCGELAGPVAADLEKDRQDTLAEYYRSGACS